MTFALLAVALGAAAQAASGLGFALVSGPLLIAALGTDDGIDAVVLLSLVLNLAVLAREHAAVRYREAALMLVPAVIATPLFVLLVRRFDEQAAAVAAGVLVVVASVLLLRGARVRALHGKAGAVAAGLAGALMNATAGIGGPPVALYAANANWAAASARSTMQVIFLVLNVVLLLVRGLPSVAPEFFLAMAAGYAVGVIGSRWLSDTAARRATLLIAAAGGVALIARAYSVPQ